MANVLLRPSTEDTGVGRYCHTRELLPPPSHTCMVDKRQSRARSIFLCVGSWCTGPRGTATQALPSGVSALVRAAIERHSISLTF